MPVFDVVTIIHDGEHEYMQHTYVYCIDWKTAIERTIRHLWLNDRKQYTIIDKDKDGEPIQWQEVSPGYRIIELDRAERNARLNVLGICAGGIEISQFMKRPVLPLSSKTADYRWESNQGGYEMWWFMGDYYVFAQWSPGDSELLYIGTFAIWELDDQFEDKKDWRLEHGHRLTTGEED